LSFISYEKREITPKWVTGFTSKLHGRQILTCWTCLQLNLTSISNSFWNKGRKVLKCWTFRPLFQKLLEIDVKFKLQKCSACQDLPTMQFWSKSRNPFWSYFPFFIKFSIKMLIIWWKKGNNSKIGNGIYFKIAW
jgi:hypothetical protein